jgi:hypothetical protein
VDRSGVRRGLQRRGDELPGESAVSIGRRECLFLVPRRSCLIGDRYLSTFAHPSAFLSPPYHKLTGVSRRYELFRHPRVPLSGGRHRASSSRRRGDAATHAPADARPDAPADAPAVARPDPRGHAAAHRRARQRRPRRRPRVDLRVRPRLRRRGDQRVHEPELRLGRGTSRVTGEECVGAGNTQRARRGGCDGRVAAFATWEGGGLVEVTAPSSSPYFLGVCCARWWRRRHRRPLVRRGSKATN